MAETAAIELNDIAHRFGRRWAIRGVSLRTTSGEVRAIVGHNGSGKSTLLRVAATAIRPTRGSGRIFGVDLAGDPYQVRAMMALLSTDAGVYGDLTALENLRFSARMLGTADDRSTLLAALERVGLERDADERARTLSSGMQRRLSIARLLLREPRVLLLDEPYNSLDVEGAALVNTLVRETRDRGGCVLLVAHDLSRSEGLADRIDRMQDGMLTTEQMPNT